ncbi:hypothetical protein CMV_013068 [Castanea mollissima]|uniref:BTB domain-containing protein n=1 Tax=Castanea mollissima TaxID=60419 RepID=A0A8J4VM91_9ROSI|nr:hypothetical protein CMV_013068 [Castanea mollissima]
MENDEPVVELEGSICCVATAAATNAETLSSSNHPSPPPDISALRRLSQNLESLFNDSSSSDRFADAKILVGTEQVDVHRCLLVARSPFFKNAFSNSKEVELKLKDLAKDHEVGLDPEVGDGVEGKGLVVLGGGVVEAVKEEPWMKRRGRGREGWGGDDGVPKFVDYGSTNQSLISGFI